MLFKDQDIKPSAHLEKKLEAIRSGTKYRSKIKEKYEIELKTTDL